MAGGLHHKTSFREVRSHSEEPLRYTPAVGGAARAPYSPPTTSDGAYSPPRSQSPPPLPTKEAIERATSLSIQLAASSIRSHVTDTGDLMLDMTGYKTSDEEALRAELIARKVLSEELMRQEGGEGGYDIGALIGVDEDGNLWIYSSEEAKEAAEQRAQIAALDAGGALGPPHRPLTSDAASDPGYHSDTSPTTHRRADSDNFLHGFRTPPHSPTEPVVPTTSATDPSRNYAKTLRLTSTQLHSLSLKPGPNIMSFTVNRATCTAYMYLWSHSTPIVISDIDGTITKSDALGHVLNMIGRDWTHIGVAKLYTEIVANGYNIMYLTSRAVGQADTTRGYLAGVQQDGYRLPRGPTIMSPDRTIAALRREVYLRKPEVFKMACLRDIRNLYDTSQGGRPFYAGFGNRLTDALSYRSVGVGSNRIFTINSYAEVSLDLLSLNKMRLSYVNMREVVDHYFPPVNQLLKKGEEEYTDFAYWRDRPLEIEEFSDSDESDVASGRGQGSEAGSDAGSEDEGGEDEMRDSYISQDEQSLISGSERGQQYEEEDEEDEDMEQASLMSASLHSAMYEQEGGLVDDLGEGEPRQSIEGTDSLSLIDENSVADFSGAEDDLTPGDDEGAEPSPTPLAEKPLKAVAMGSEEVRKSEGDGPKAAEEEVEAEDAGPQVPSPRRKLDRTFSREEYEPDVDAEIITGMKGVMINDDAKTPRSRAASRSRASSRSSSMTGSRTGSVGGGRRKRSNAGSHNVM